MDIKKRYTGKILVYKEHLLVDNAEGLLQGFDFVEQL